MKVQTYKLSANQTHHVGVETRWWVMGAKCYASMTPPVGNACGRYLDLEMWINRGELIPAEVVEVADEPQQRGYFTSIDPDEPHRRGYSTWLCQCGVDLRISVCRCSNTYAGIDRSKPDEWGVGLPSRAKPFQDAAAAHGACTEAPATAPSGNRCHKCRDSLVGNDLREMTDGFCYRCRQKVRCACGDLYTKANPKNYVCPKCAGRMMEAINSRNSIAALELRANQVQNVSPFAASVQRCDKEAMR